jgi:hypothetical protein
MGGRVDPAWINSSLGILYLEEVVASALFPQEGLSVASIQVSISGEEGLKF